jgi:hypothetical protein
MFSWVDFCGLKGLPLYTEVLEDLIHQVGSPLTTFAQRIIDLFPPLNGMNSFSSTSCFPFNLA